MSMSFGEYLAATMKARGFPTAASLSRATDIRDGVLSKWLNDRNEEPPRTYMLRRLVDALGVPLIELVVAAKIMTPEEANLPGMPEPPSPPGEDEINELIDSSPVSEESKERMRAEFARLRQLAFEEKRRSPTRSSRSTEADAPKRRRSA